MNSRASGWLLVGGLVAGWVGAVSCSPGKEDPPGGAGASGGAGGATGGAAGTGTGGKSGGGAGGATGGVGGASGTGGATGGAGGAGGSAGTTAGAGGSAGTAGTLSSGGMSGAGGATGGAGAAAGGAGAGGSSGTAGTGAGGSGGTPATLTMPIMKSATSYVLEFGDLYFEVNPMLGGRIVNVHLTGGTNLFGGMGDNTGSVFWPSPQTWMWPPTDAGSITAINDKPYTPSADTTSMTMVGMTATALNLSVTKKYAADLAKQAVVVTYTMSASAGGVMAAPWEITRFPQAGVTFYPTGSTPVAGGTMALPPTTTSAGATWLTAPATRPATDQKMLADGTGGWLAHAAGDWVIVKKFTDMPANMAAPNEAEIEIYLSAAADYMEVEQQGPYGAVPMGGMVNWTVTWFVRRLPQGVTPTASQPLFDFVAALVQ